MSLKFFHVFFISLATLMLLGGAWLAWSNYREEAGRTPLVTAVVCLVSALSLTAYGVWFLKKTRKLIL